MGKRPLDFILVVEFVLLCHKNCVDAFWIQPGMNHVVACCDVVSFSATNFTLDRKIKKPEVILNTTLINDPIVEEFQPEKLAGRLSTAFPVGAVVLPLVPSLDFHAHNWYNVCVERFSNDSRRKFCFPFRPCDCAYTNSEASPWLKILINVSVKSESILLRLTSVFSIDTPPTLRVRFNVTIQSKRYFEDCHQRKPQSLAADSDEEKIQMRKCQRENRVRPQIELIRIHPSEEIQIATTQVGSLPFFILLSIDVTDSKSIGRDIDFAHALDAIEVGKDANANENGSYERLILVPVPTPRIEQGPRPLLDWDENDSNKLCSLIREIETSKRKASKASRSNGLFFAITATLIAINLIRSVIDRI